MNKLKCSKRELPQDKVHICCIYYFSAFLFFCIFLINFYKIKIPIESSGAVHNAHQAFKSSAIKCESSAAGAYSPCWSRIHS
ncbi:hypothetical protein GDO81_013044 [Engystomops pustulosus]|uniref:Uncharacterized protein n=1 Tax=Engystomops pustulosus TaxID=76066 RepID=A0AAV7B139_ENGPU|nr:hypothetical protein GDO81_013044 [Engystomops pustulosus]